MYKSRNIMSHLRDMKLVPCGKSVDLTGVLSRHATLFESLGLKYLTLRRVPMI